LCRYAEAGCDLNAGFEDRVPMPEGDGFKGRKKYGRCAVVGLYDLSSRDPYTLEVYKVKQK
jgi:hypothetical protein